jgi:ketosteroid isomerase-like protein
MIRLATPAVRRFATIPSMPTPLDLVRGLYAAFAAGDVPAFLAALSPDIRWCEAEGFPLADGNPYVGPDAIVQGVFARLGDHWTDFRVEPGEFAGSGDVVTMFGRYRAVGKATGKPLDVQVAHTFWVRDGKVVRFQQMCDTAAVAASLAVEASKGPVRRKRGKVASRRGKPAPVVGAKGRAGKPARQVRSKPAAKVRKPAGRRGRR